MTSANGAADTDNCEGRVVSVYLHLEEPTLLAARFDRKRAPPRNPCASTWVRLCVEEDAFLSIECAFDGEHDRPCGALRDVRRHGHTEAEDTPGDKRDGRVCHTERWPDQALLSELARREVKLAEEVFGVVSETENRVVESVLRGVQQDRIIERLVLDARLDLLWPASQASASVVKSVDVDHFVEGGDHDAVVLEPSPRRAAVGSPARPVGFVLAGRRTLRHASDWEEGDH